MTSDLTNDAIAKQIAAGDIQYDRIVYFEKDLDGRITALKTNMGEINRLKTDILNIINDEILELVTSDIGIPVLMHETYYNKEYTELTHFSDWPYVYKYVKARWYNE